MGGEEAAAGGTMGVVVGCVGLGGGYRRSGRDVLFVGLEERHDGVECECVLGAECFEGVVQDNCWLGS